jgi:hypothetical protein
MYSINVRNMDRIIFDYQHYNVPILRQREEVSWIVGTTALETLICINPLQLPMPRVIQKTIFITESYDVVITTIIFVNRMAG